MDLAWLKDFGGFIKDLATVVLPIIGVMVGAKLASRSADDQWLKKERLTAYLDLIDQLTAMLKQFAVGMKVSKFGHHAEGSDHDEASVLWEWQEQMDGLERAEVKAKILGGHLGFVYESTADDLIGEMLEALDDPDITEAHWDALSSRGHDLRAALEKSAAADLEVPIIRSKRRLWERQRM
jgi:hypothetical protein